MVSPGAIQLLAGSPGHRETNWGFCLDFPVVGLIFSLRRVNPDVFSVPRVTAMVLLPR
ncbi:MAG: hypothetical protein ACI8UO_004960 [Verrucomicrobiales bacterium]|jgi:hypothetical protein